MSSGRHGTAVASDGQILRTRIRLRSGSKTTPTEAELTPASWLAACGALSELRQHPNSSSPPCAPSHWTQWRLLPEISTVPPPPPTTEVRLSSLIFHAYSEKEWFLCSEIIALLALQMEAVLSSPQETPTQTGRSNTKLSHSCTSFQSKCATSPCYCLCEAPATSGE